MPFGGALTLGAIGAGSSKFGAILGNRKKEYTNTTTPTLSPELQQIMNKLLADAGGMATDPARGLAPMRTAAMNNINGRYAGAADRVTTNLAKRGYRSSGKLPGAFTGIEMSRLSDMSDLEGQFAQLGSQRQLAGMGLTADVLSRMTGSTSKGTTPGNMAGAGLSAAGSSLGSLSSLMMLNNMLKG